MIKKYFKTGLLLLIPLIVTAIIVLFIINFLTSPFIYILANIFRRYDIFNSPFLFLTETQTLFLASRMIALTLLLAGTILVGFLGKMFFINYFLKVGDYLMMRIPLINKIYKTVQEIVTTVFSSQTQKFSAVVLVHFPHSNGLNIGLVASQVNAVGSDPEFVDQITVFVPSGLNPSVGLSLLFKKEELIFVDMKVEDALKFIVSCGLIFQAEKSSDDCVTEAPLQTTL